MGAALLRAPRHAVVAPPTNVVQLRPSPRIYDWATDPEMVAPSVTVTITTTPVALAAAVAYLTHPTAPRFISEEGDRWAQQIDAQR